MIHKSDHVCETIMKKHPCKANAAASSIGCSGNTSACAEFGYRMFHHCFRDLRHHHRMKKKMSQWVPPFHCIRQLQSVSTFSTLTQFVVLFSSGFFSGLAAPKYSKGLLIYPIFRSARIQSKQFPRNSFMGNGELGIHDKAQRQLHCHNKVWRTMTQSQT